MSPIWSSLIFLCTAKKPFAEKLNFIQSGLKLKMLGPVCCLLRVWIEANKARFTQCKSSGLVYSWSSLITSEDYLCYLSFCHDAKTSISDQCLIKPKCVWFRESLSKSYTHTSVLEVWKRRCYRDIKKMFCDCVTWEEFVTQYMFMFLLLYIDLSLTTAMSKNKLIN